MQLHNLHILEQNPKRNIFVSAVSNMNLKVLILNFNSMLPSFNVHWISPVALLTACREPSSVDINSSASGKLSEFYKGKRQVHLNINQ